VLFLLFTSSFLSAYNTEMVLWDIAISAIDLWSNSSDLQNHEIGIVPPTFGIS